MAVVLFAVGPSQRSAQEDLRPSDGGGAFTRDVAATAIVAGLPPAAVAVEPSSERVALAADEERAATAPPVAATIEVDAQLTRIVARVVDGTVKALDGATLLAVRANGTPRGSAPSPPADDTGVVLLALRDNELRAYKEEKSAMVFAVRAHA